MNKSIVYVFVILGMFASTVFADGGFIPFDPSIDVYEPGQKAIIGWNGEKEVLILSIDAYASEATTALQIIPLPSEPEIEGGDFDSFVKMEDLIAWNMPRPAGYDENIMDQGKGGVDIIFHEQIGAHDVTAVHVNDWTDFASWLEGYLTARDMPTETISMTQEKVVYYLERNINYFVFDLVDLEDYVGSKQPLIYTFETNSLYYPLVISTLTPGFVDIKLFIITEEKPEAWHFTGPYAEHVVKSTPLILNFDFYTQFKLYKDDIEWIEPKLIEVIDDDGWLTVSTYEGPIDIFTQDINTNLGLVESGTELEHIGPLAWVVGLVFLVLLVTGISLLANSFSKWTKKAKK